MCVEYSLNFGTDFLYTHALRHLCTCHEIPITCYFSKTSLVYFIVVCWHKLGRHTRISDAQILAEVAESGDLLQMSNRRRHK